MTLLLVGAFGVGKTAWRRYQQAESFEQHYLPTIGTETSIMQWSTEYGIVEVQCVEIPGQGSPNMFRSQLPPLPRVDAALFLWDTQSPRTRDILEKWRVAITGSYGPVPIVSYGTKADTAQQDHTQTLSNKTGHGHEDVIRTLMQYYPYSSS